MQDRLAFQARSERSRLSGRFQAALTHWRPVAIPVTSAWFSAGERSPFLNRFEFEGWELDEGKVFGACYEETSSAESDLLGVCCRQR